MKKIRNNVAMLVFSLSVSLPAIASEGSDESKSLTLFAAEVANQNDESLLFLGDGPVASNVEYSYENYGQSSSLLEVVLDQDMVNSINQSTENYKDMRMSFVHEGRVFTAPKLLSPVVGRRVVMTFDGKSDVSDVEKILNPALKL